MKIQGPNPEQSALEIIGDELQKSLDSAQKNAIFRVTVGYISDSGLSKLEKPLKKIIAQGGTVEVIVGLNQISKRSVRRWSSPLTVPMRLAIGTDDSYRLER